MALRSEESKDRAGGRAGDPAALRPHLAQHGPSPPCHHSTRSDLHQDYSLANWGLCKTIPADKAVEESGEKPAGPDSRGLCCLHGGETDERKKPFERKNLD